MEEAILSEDTAKQVCAGDLLIFLLIKKDWVGHAFTHIGEGKFSFKVCLMVSGVSGRESLDRDILPKAIFSFYSTLCMSHLLSGLFAFKAS